LNINELANVQAGKLLKINLVILLSAEMIDELFKAQTRRAYKRVFFTFWKVLSINAFFMVPTDALLTLDIVYFLLFEVLFLSTTFKDTS
jgi:hypothetical protein